MSDYMFMLESHLSADQNRAVAELIKEASHANVNLFLTGGAMRDMLGGFQVRDLDFTVEGNALKLAKTVATRTHARVLETDDNRKSTELLFPTGVRAEISMSRQEVYPRTGARPQVTPAPIQDDLRRRDFTINAIALSLNRGSRGLLIDPTNGLADLGNKELRATHSYTFFDDPARLLRLIRFRVRFGFTVDERTERQYQNAREAGVEKYIAGRDLFEELRSIAEEQSAADVLRAFEKDGMLAIFSETLAGPKLSFLSLAKLERLKRLFPVNDGFGVGGLAPFLSVLTEKFNPRERTALAKTLEMRRSELDMWQKLEPRVKKLEHELKSARLRQPSQIYQVVSKAAGEEILYLMYRSGQKIVQDRLRNYLQKYYPAAQEVTDAEVEKAGAKPGTAKFAKLKEQLIITRLNTRKKPAPPPPPPELVAPVPVMAGRERR
jgi:tRNA nucleotidyltransferase (CCA-adding enzyme)